MNSESTSLLRGSNNIHSSPRNNNATTKRRLLIIVGVVLLVFFYFVGTRQLANHPLRKKKNVILLISDGFGPASQTFARQYVQATTDPKLLKLPLDTILVGSSQTRSSSSLVTDSAAGATAFSCAIKSYNAAIGVDPERLPCGTVLESASLLGYKTGLVVKSRITHATPAAFSAHVVHRDLENLIALQQIGVEEYYPLGRTLDLMFGGGHCHFLRNTTDGSCRDDDIDVLSLSSEIGWTYVNSSSTMHSLSSESFPVLGLFSPDHMSYRIDRTTQPSLLEMTKKALTLLNDASKDSNGFFVMIEGSRIDMAAHSNDPATHLHEILEYNEVIAYVKQFVEENPETVMISVSDHETGGFAVARQVNASYPSYLWYPHVLDKVLNSTEILAPFIAALPLEGKTKAVVKILNDWVGVTDGTEEEIQGLVTSDSGAVENILGEIISKRAQLGWSTHGHSAVDVNLYAYGAKSNLLRGQHDNTDVGHFIVDYMKLDLQSVTEKLRKFSNLASGGKARSVPNKSSNHPEKFEEMHFHGGL